MTGVVKQATRIASVEQVELGDIMELSVIGQVLKWARHMHPEDCHCAEQLGGT